MSNNFKHLSGIVKTHRLLLNTPGEHVVPNLPDAPNENRVSVRPRTVKEIVDHFPAAKGPKSDPQLIWRFGEDEVTVKSIESSIDVKGASCLLNS